MKVISYSECRNCGTQFINNKVTIEASEEIELICKKIQRCSQCKMTEDRNTNRKNDKANELWS